MPVLLAFTLLSLQQDPVRLVEALSSDRIDERGAAARRIKQAQEEFRDATRLWAMAVAIADPLTLIRLGRIRGAWVSELGYPGVAKLPVVDPPDYLPDPPTPRDSLVEWKLRNVHLTLTADQVPLPLIVDVVHQISGIDVILCGIEAPQKILFNVNVNDGLLERALRDLCESQQLGFVVREGALLVLPDRNLTWTLPVKAYAVADLLTTRTPRELGWEILFRMGPELWHQTGGRSIHCMGCSQVVRNVASVHEHLEQLLAELRRPATPRIRRDPAKSLTRLFQDLWGKDAGTAEQQLSELARDLTGLLRRLVAAEETADVNLKLEVIELGNVLLRGLGDDSIRRVLRLVEP